jgi:3-dehydroquinate synthase
MGPALLDNPATFAHCPKRRNGADRDQHHCGSAVCPALDAAISPHHKKVAVLDVELPDGEQYKDWPPLNQIFTKLLEAPLTARPCCTHWAAAWWAT